MTNDDLFYRINEALARLVSVRPTMSIPARASDPDVVLSDCHREIVRLREENAELTQFYGKQRQEQVYQSMHSEIRKLREQLQSSTHNDWHTIADQRSAAPIASEAERERLRLAIRLVLSWRIPQDVRFALTGALEAKP